MSGCIHGLGGREPQRRSRGFLALRSRRARGYGVPALRLYRGRAGLGRAPHNCGGNSVDNARPFSQEALCRAGGRRQESKRAGAESSVAGFAAIPSIWSVLPLEERRHDRDEQAHKHRATRTTAMATASRWKVNCIRYEGRCPGSEGRWTKWRYRPLYRRRCGRVVQSGIAFSIIGPVFECMIRRYLLTEACQFTRTLMEERSV